MCQRLYIAALNSIADVVFSESRGPSGGGLVVARSLASGFKRLSSALSVCVEYLRTGPGDRDHYSDFEGDCLNISLAATTRGSESCITLDRFKTP